MKGFVGHEPDHPSLGVISDLTSWKGIDNFPWFGARFDRAQVWGGL